MSPVSCMTRSAAAACGSERMACSGGHKGCARSQYAAKLSHAFSTRRSVFGGQRDAVTRDEFEQAKEDGGIDGQLRGRAQIDALVGNREFRIREPRAPVAKLRQPASFRFARSESSARRASL